MIMAHDEKSRLGRGLAALIGDVGDEAAVLDRTRSQRRVPIEFLKPNPRNPRRNFADAELDELAASIRERGIIQPILVRTVRGAMDQYEIVAGERRWRAAQRAGLHDVPVLLLEINDREALELAIIENVQRTDLNAIEEAGGYQALMNEFDYSQDDVAKIVGKSRPHVANTLRLLKLSEPVKAYITSGQISAGHARLLVGQPNAEEFAEQIVARGLNVRQVEQMARRDGKKQVRELRRTGRIGPDPDAAALEKRLGDVLGLGVRILHRVDGEGVISIRYRSLEQLDDITRRLETGPVVGAPKPSPLQLESRREDEEERAREAANKGPRIRGL
jgi:ParB family chromosome partitioning protein